MQLQPVELGVNARRIKRASAASTFANAVYVDGKDEVTTPVWWESADLPDDPRGRWEVAQGFPSVELQATLNEHAAGLLSDVNSPVTTWAVSMEPSRWLKDSLYLPGDFVTLVIPRSTVAPIGTPAERVICQVEETAATLSGDGSVEVACALVETRQVVE